MIDSCAFHATFFRIKLAGFCYHMHDCPIVTIFAAPDEVNVAKKIGAILSKARSGHSDGSAG